MTATVFSAAVTNVLADENGEEKSTESLNPDVAIGTNGCIHVVWQERVFEKTPETIYEDIYPTDDTYIHSLDYSANYGSEPDLYVGLYSDCDTMMYLKFNLSSIKNITNAVLYLYQTAGMVEDTSKYLKIHPVSSDWKEDTVTWDTFPDYGRTIYTVPGADCIACGKWLAVDITELTKKWVNNEIINYGIVMETGSSFGCIVFASKEAEEKPHIKIAYTQEQKLTSDYEIFYANNLTGAYNSEINTAIQKVQSLILNASDKKLKNELEKVLKELNKTLANATASDYQHSFKHLQHAVERLDKKDLGNKEIIVALVDSVMNITKVNILYREYQNISANHITKAWEKYEKALERVNEEKYDKAVNEFRKAFKEAYKIDDNCEDEECNKKTESGVDFGRIVRISYTDYDSVYPKLFLNGTISVGWIEILPEGNHTSYARSEDGVSWWYFDATEYASTYLCYAGVDPSMLSIENILTITRTLERIWILDRCHYFYAPIIRDGFTIEDRRVYAPLNDPYLTIYDGKYEPILIGDKKFYIICGGPNPLPPPKAPDLLVSSIFLSPETPIEGYKPNVIVTITNQGDADTGSVSTHLKDDFNRTVYLGVSNIAAKSSFQAIIPPWPWNFSAGSRKLTAVIDPNNNIPEGDEGNNLAEKIFDAFTYAGDNDSDGLINYHEVYIHKTSLLNPDTDSDGLWDGYNITVENNTYIGEFSIRTNNLNPDTDADGLYDGKEVVKARTNPLINDTDGDGLLDGVELEIGTCPSNPDSDGDGISDKDDATPTKVVDLGVWKTVNAEEEILLNGSLIDPNGSRYYWDMNDDGEFDAFTPNASYCWYSEGENNVTLMVVDKYWNRVNYTFKVNAIFNSTFSEKILYTTLSSKSAGSPPSGYTQGGLQGEYYDNADFTNLKTTRVDSTVNFNWGDTIPSSTAITHKDTFSIRWTGKLKVDTAGTYTFYTTTDDGVRLYVGGSLIIDKWKDQSATEYSATKTLSVGYHDIMMEYYENAVDARAELRWKPPASAPGATTIVWVEDALPAGATAYTDSDTWTWVTSPVYSGSKSHKSDVRSGMHQHYFMGATSTLSISAGDILIQYIWIPSGSVPSEIMLQFHCTDGSGWAHRAYWGSNLISWGTDGTASRKYQGAIPSQRDQWVKLSVAASAVGLEGKTINGWAYTLYDGGIYWDRSGIETGVKAIIPSANLYYGTDLDPNQNLELTIKIKRIAAQDPVDYGTEADFYVKIFVGGWEKKSGEPIQKDKNDISPNLQFTWDVSDFVENVPVKIEVWDDDYPWSDDDLCDISKTDRSLDVTYTLKRGSWSGEDSVGDSSGYGYADGREDGSTPEPAGNWDNNQDDCAVWFDVYQNDGDGDGLTYWEEVNVYGTSASVKNDRYAVILFCSGKQYPTDDDEPHITWYWNLVRSMYDILRWQGYSDQNIYFLGYKASGRDGVVDMDTTKTNIQNVFNKFKSGGTHPLDGNDILFVFWVGQGYQGGFEIDGTQTTGGRVTYSEFANYLSGITTWRTMLCMHPCYSGGVIASVAASNHIVITSCLSTEHDNGWGEHFRDGLRGSGDTFAPHGNNDGYTSLNEAYYYGAERAHTQVSPPQHSLIEDCPANGNSGTWYATCTTHGITTHTYNPADSTKDGYLAARTYI